MNRHILILAVCAALFAAHTSSAFATILPELPRQYLQTKYDLPIGGTTYKVKTSLEFTNALKDCQLGDVIELQAGTVYRGPFVLPNKTTGSGWVYITTSGLSQLPPACTRVAASDAISMPCIEVLAGVGGAVQTSTGAHHYRFVGIEFRPVAGNYVYNIFQIGNSETAESALPNNIVLDRCYVHGDPVAGSRRGVMMNGAAIAVVDSYISDCKEVGADSQALAMWSGTGPFKIVNNYLEGAGENLMFGGSDPSIKNNVPSDIEIRCNYFFKPLAWQSENWVVKNLLEFKNARRVLVEGNRFENNWPAGQNGFALLITPRNQNNTAPWCATQDITIRANTFTNIAQGINILGMDAPNISERTNRVLIQDNLLLAVRMTNSDGRMFQLLGDPVNVTINHNTAFCPVAYVVAESTPTIDSFTFQNNIVSHGVYGFIGTGTGDGNNTLSKWFSPNWSVTNNAIIGGTSTGFPNGNLFPKSTDAVGFVDTISGNFGLSAGSPYKNAATDGRDLGASMDSLRIARTYLCEGPAAVLETKNLDRQNRLYPNPADRAIIIQLEAVSGEASTISLIDDSGRILESLHSANPSETFNTSKLPNGAYLLRVESGGVSDERRFIVLH